MLSINVGLAILSCTCRDCLRYTTSWLLVVLYGAVAVTGDHVPLLASGGGFLFEDPAIQVDGG